MSIVEPAFGIIPLDLIQPSTTNPRKRFSETGLAELAASIGRSGVGQPILVRPLPDQDGAPVSRVEIVAGERRYRASKLAGLQTIPAIVRDMSNAEVLEFQLVENLQREDVHPIEEAEGYERLMAELKLNADQVADKVGKSRSYIYGRLKLCALSAEARTAFYDGKLNASTALLVARIPLPELQVRATREIAGSMNGGEAMSYRRAQQHLQQHYTLQLDSAPWALDDAELLPAAGSCIACPKRCGNQPEIYGDLDPNVCTDPDCHGEKRAAHTKRVEAAATADGIPIHDEGSAGAIAAANADDNLPTFACLWNMERPKEGQNRSERPANVLKTEQLPPAVAYVRMKNGELRGIYNESAMQGALERAGICYTEQEYEEINAQKSPADSAEAIERERKDQAAAALSAEHERQAKFETGVRVEIFKRIRDANAAGLSLPVFRLLVKSMLETEFSLVSKDHGNFYPFDPADSDATFAFIDQARAIDLEQLLLDMLAPRLRVNKFEIGRNEPDYDDDCLPLAVLAAACGVDPEQVRRELAPPEEAPPTKQPAADEKPAKTKSKGGRKPQKPAAEASAATPETPAATPAAKSNSKHKKSVPATAAWPFPTAKEIDESHKQDGGEASDDA